MDIRQFIGKNVERLRLAKVSNGKPMTQIALADERMFLEVGALPAEIEKLRAGGGLGLFVRSLVGMNREAAKIAFTAFLSDANTSSDQIEFINMIVDHLTERGSMDPRLLYESPFTDIDPMGIEGIFLPSEATKIVSILHDIESRAAA
ncbi:MAG: type I restriction-modification enzyme R subunit C-terminal domain-containing protein [Beijerinckiaceae bacterium]